jgi:hypothetical protein
MEEERVVELLPPFSDFAKRADNLAVICYKGIHVGNVMTFGNLLVMCAEVAAEPLDMAQSYTGRSCFGQNCHGLISFHGSNSENVEVKVRATRDGASGRLDAMITPFAITRGYFGTNWKTFSIGSELTLRQPWSNVTAFYDLHHGFGNASVMLGNMKYGIGACLDKKSNLVKILGRYSGKKSVWSVLFNLAESGIWGIFDFQKKIFPKFGIGLNLQGGFDRERNWGLGGKVGWKGEIGKCIVKSVISSEGVVSSGFRTGIGNGWLAEVGITMNHKDYDYSLGVNLNWTRQFLLKD